MNHHKNARLTFAGRRILVSRIIHEGLPVREAARAQGVSPRTAYKWLRRFREEGEAVSTTRARRNGRSTSLSGSTTTTGTGLMAVWATRRHLTVGGWCE